MQFHLFVRCLFTVCFMLTINDVKSEESNQSNFSGIWSGYFGYYNQPASVGGSFSLAMVHDGKTVSGEIIELVMFEKTPTVARSTISGVFKNNVFNFIKTYDGSGGRDHSVNYEVKFEKGILIGEWTAGELRGPVVLSLIPSQEYAKYLETRYSK
ncbi:MAG: hypothetical protein HWE27_17980 [Gammaproteobacteria bacterium]|nr:hypothetical protein [Gammaproteobacteria bacterium]